MIGNFPEWKLEGNCVGQDLNLFFDSYEENDLVAEYVDSLCASCPIRKECLTEGKELESTGVWGGMYLRLGKYMRSKNRHKGSARMDGEMAELDEL